MRKSPLNIFHPLIAQWFSGNLGKPTDIQARAWPEIAAGRNVLIAAATGSGKTLAAFLWGIDRLATGAWPCGQTRLLYISPLKALNNDVRRNLIRPLADLNAFFRESGEPFPDIRVLSRSGDTPANERRRMLSRPPEILITTPESLNLLLGSKNGRRIFYGLAAVILDEIHAVAASKRGVHLITAVDRLVLSCGEFQRIALSATIRPAERVAEFVGGYRLEGDSRKPAYRRRAVLVIRSHEPKALAVTVRFPADARERLTDDSWWPVLVEQFKEIIRNNRATLLFANSRRLTEKVARLINADEPEMLAYAHHGSLSRELRLTVERKLKRGELKAIVATNSLELGIDIGSLDQVVLIQTPPSISSALQRIGRSGHRVKEVSRGTLFPTHGRDFLNAAVAARCVMEQDIETLNPLEVPLDVLSQVILSMTAVDVWNPDQLYAFLKTSFPYHGLSRRQFDLVLEMLAGRYADTRLRELSSRLSIDRIDNTVKARPGAAMLLNLSGGTIPDRGYFDLRLAESGAKIGELDEEFVWERSVGDTFAMGNQTWRIRKITHNQVEAVPAGGRPGIIPFWRAEARNRDFHLSRKLLEFLEYADAALDQDGEALAADLRKSFFMDEAAAGELIDFLQRQKAATGTKLPHRHHLLVEHFEDPLNRADSKQVILHTGWGGRINRPYAMALAQFWENAHGYALEVFADDDAILLLLPDRFEVRDLLDAVHSENIEALLRQKLEKTGFFGARFRENAARALLLPRATFKKRMPLWLNRLRARKLMEAVIAAPDFPILLETWRTCMRDEFDLENLKLLLDELTEGRIAVGETYTASASPFAHGLIWQQTNQYMYADDTPASGKTSGLTEELVREVAGSSALRPRIPEVLVRQLVQKLQRTAPGYAPSDSAELLDWVKERLVIPASEWEDLLAAVAGDHGLSPAALLDPVSSKIIGLRFPGAAIDSVCAVETLPRIGTAFGLAAEALSVCGLTGGSGGSDTDRLLLGHMGALPGAELPAEPAGEDLAQACEAFMSQWLSFYGPLPASFLAEVFGLSDARLSAVLESLKDRQQIIADRLREGAVQIEVCDRENLEILLRMARKARQPAFEALAADALPLFLAAFQGLTSTGGALEDLEIRLEQLFGICLPAAAWEEFVFPARLAGYQTFWIDSLMQTSGLRWFGCGEKRIGFAFEEDFALFVPLAETNRAPEEAGNPAATDDPSLIPDRRGRYAAIDIAGRLGLNPEQTVQKLWESAWMGKIGNDTFEAIRSGILNKFSAPPAARLPSAGRRGGFNRWKSARTLTGNWYALDVPAGGFDEVQAAELRKERIRQLFRRYGILFKGLLARELPVLQWGSLFRTLRLMELSGEIVSGHFFEGIPGLQFASHEAFRFLQHPLPEDAVFWLNAADPASLCGVGGLDPARNLPARIASTYLVFQGRNLVLSARQSGKILDIDVSPDHPLLSDYYSFFKVLLGRAFNPRHFVLIETVNGEPAVNSPYAESLRRFGFSGTYNGLELRRAV